MTRLYLSYRRADAGNDAAYFAEKLAAVFGRENVFYDVASIPVGIDFRSYIEQQIAATDVMVVFIGKQWLTARDANGTRRLDDPADYVRHEISTALANGTTVIPVLIDAPMPTADQLPADLRGLSEIQAISIPTPRDRDAALYALDDAIQQAPRRLTDAKPVIPTQPFAPPTAALPPAKAPPTQYLPLVVVAALVIAAIVCAVVTTLMTNQSAELPLAAATQIAFEPTQTRIIQLLSTAQAETTEIQAIDPIRTALPPTAGFMTRPTVTVIETRPGDMGDEPSSNETPEGTAVSGTLEAATNTRTVNNPPAPTSGSTLVAEANLAALYQTATSFAVTLNALQPTLNPPINGGVPPSTTASPPARVPAAKHSCWR